MEAEITYPFTKHDLAYDAFLSVSNLDTLVKIITEQTNLYAQKKGREFQTDEKEMEEFFGNQLRDKC